ncbi:MAG: hypothetical protein K6E35_00210 [Bacteroidales bacterium]|nr:hypothetical protein [Bacteroidales bacterium]
MESINTAPPSTPPCEARIQEILDEQRTLAHDTLDDLMHEAFLEIGEVLAVPQDATGTPPALPDKAIRGLSVQAMQQIRQHYSDGDLTEWLTSGADGNKIRYLYQFLNFSALQMQEFRVRFPRAFQKWTEEEDNALLAQYRQDTEEGRRVPWGRLSAHFGRNPNALRLRLEHLGIELGDEAGRPRRPDRAR